MRNCRVKNGASTTRCVSAVTAVSAPTIAAEVVGADVGEHLAGLRDLHQRAGGAQPQAPDSLHGHVGQPGIGDLLAEADQHVVRTASTGS